MHQKVDTRYDFVFGSSVQGFCFALLCSSEWRAALLATPFCFFCPRREQFIHNQLFIQKKKKKGKKVIVFCRSFLIYVGVISSIIPLFVHELISYD